MCNKRVDVVNIQLVKEKSIIYEGRTIKNPLSAYLLLKDSSTPFVPKLAQNDIAR